jgi:RNase H-like domain found in reverse transcriptase
MISVLKALMKWEDKLLGQKFTLITDHKGLEYFETQKNLSDRQVQCWEFLSHFNFTIMHIDGVENKVADCLSCYYENDTGDKSHLEHIYMNADARLDPDSELLPTDRYMELKTAATRWSNHLIKKREAQILESK